MNKRRIKGAPAQPTFVVAIVFGLLLLSCSAEREQRPVDPIASAYIAAVTKSDFMGAARLFHYPEDMQGQDRQDAEADAAAGVRAMHNCFGEPRNASDGYGGIVYEFGFGPGDLAHWEQHPKVRPVDVEVTFAKLGPGKIHFDLIPIGGDRWEVRQVKYGLPLSDPRTELRMAQCGAAVTAVMNAHAE